MPCTSWGVRVRLSCRVHAVADVRGVSGEALALAQGGDECNAIAIYLAVILMHCTIVKLKGE